MKVEAMTEKVFLPRPSRPFARPAFYRFTGLDDALRQKKEPSSNGWVLEITPSSNALTMIERFARLIPSRLNPWGPTTGSSKLRLPTYSIGGPNLEILKFGIYIMFPIGWMYYFGTNLENRFSVPDFWPTPEMTNKIPYEKAEQEELVAKLKTARLERRRKRLEAEERSASVGDTHAEMIGGSSTAAQEELVASSSVPKDVRSRNTFGLGLIDKWASGKQ